MWLTWQTFVGTFLFRNLLDHFFANFFANFVDDVVALRHGDVIADVLLFLSRHFLVDDFALLRRHVVANFDVDRDALLLLDVMALDVGDGFFDDGRHVFARPLRNGIANRLGLLAAFDLSKNNELGLIIWMVLY